MPSQLSCVVMADSEANEAQTAPPTPDQLAELVRLVAESRRLLVLTGAGMSTESGLPDYRGASGLWRERRFEELASIEAFRCDPVLFWEFYRMRLDHLRQASPNAGHYALAALQQAGIVAEIVTQNVDGLHTAAGSDAVEIHGSLRRARCLACGTSIEAHQLEGRAAADAQRVPRCSCGEPFKPDVVLFGELLPEAAVERAWSALETCDAILVCGSSLAVAPVGSFPMQMAMRGARVAIVNRGVTAADSVADVRIEASLGPVLEHVAAELLDAR